MAAPACQNSTNKPTGGRALPCAPRPKPLRDTIQLSSQSGRRRDSNPGACARRFKTLLRPLGHSSGISPEVKRGRAQYRIAIHL